jgi:diguanylate cyclase (GGDEF)-like protein/PAS domain S-box-containing protein
MPLPEFKQAIGQLALEPICRCEKRHEDATVDTLNTALAAHDVHAVVITADGKPVGLWTEEDALLSAENRAALSRLNAPHILPASMSCGDAAAYLKIEGAQCAIVEDLQHRLLGLLTPTQFMQSDAVLPDLRGRSIASAHVRIPLTMTAEMPMSQAMTLMLDQHTQALAVRYPAAGMGILTQRQVVRWLAAGAPPTTAGAHASQPLHILHQTQSLALARRYMLKHRVRYLGVRDDLGNLVGILGSEIFLTHLTHRYLFALHQALDRERNAITQLDGNLRFINQVFEATLNGVMVTDTHGNIARVNPAFTRLTGYSADEVTGRNAAILSSGRQSKAFYQALWHDLQTSGHWEGEIWNRRKDGELYFEYLTISAIVDAGGKPAHFVAIFFDLTHRAKTEERLMRLATHDALTDLPNRMLLDERVEQAVLRARRSQKRVALLFVDLDHFKDINDTHGHAAGDEVLKIIAQRLRTAVRDIDTVARIGGDEFVLVLEDMADPEAAAAIAEKLLHAVAAPFELDNVTVALTPSIGIALYPEDGPDTGTLLAHADEAMYQAKQAGRNTYHLYRSGRQSTVRRGSRR